MFLAEWRIVVRRAAGDYESAASARGRRCGRTGDRVPTRLPGRRQNDLRAPRWRTRDRDPVAEGYLAAAMVDHVDERVPTPREVVRVMQAVRDRHRLAAADWERDER